MTIGRTEGVDPGFFLKRGRGVEIFYHYEIHIKLVSSEIGVIGRGAKGFGVFRVIRVHSDQDLV
jgi:hypothetical protein